MMSFVPLFLVSVLFPAMQATQLTNCEVSQKLKDMDGYGNVTLLEWTCIIFHISGYNTETVTRNNDSTEYGLFQISNKLWCGSSHFPEAKNICGIACDKFLDDDLTDDMVCAKKILDIKGIDHWLAHKPLCSEQLEQWRCNKL